MEVWRISIANKWIFNIPHISISFQNGWRYKPWVDTDGYGIFPHLWRFIVEDRYWLKKIDKDAPVMDYLYVIHIWFLEFGMHVFVG